MLSFVVMCDMTFELATEKANFVQDIDKDYYERAQGVHRMKNPPIPNVTSIWL